MLSVWRYAAWYVGACAAMMAVGVALAMLAGLEIPNGAATIVPVIAAAMGTGQAFGRAQGRPLESREAWAGALRMTGVAALINGAFLAAFLAATDVAAILGQVPIGFLAATLGALLIVSFLVNRWFLGVGAKSGARAKPAA